MIINHDLDPERSAAACREGAQQPPPYTRPPTIPVTATVSPLVTGAVVAFMCLAPALALYDWLTQ